MLNRFFRPTICRTRQFSYMVHDKTINTKDFFKAEYDAIKPYYPQFIKYTCEKDYMVKFTNISERYKSLMDSYVNVPRSHLASCLMVLYAYKVFEKPELLTEENLKKAYGLCWVTKTIEASAIVLDDILDNCSVRYDKPSWVNLEGANKTSLDCLFLEYSAFMYLQDQLKDHPNCLKIIQLYKDDFNRLNVAQLMDIRKVGSQDAFELFEGRLQKGDCVMHSPIRAAMYLANINNSEYHDKVGRIVRNISRYSVLQNDYWDMYPPEIHKECNDIIEGKSTWFYVQALKIATPSQMKIINENYGKSCQESVKKVEQIYMDLKLGELFEKSTEEYFNDIHIQIEQLPDELPKYFFHDCILLMKNGFVNG